MFGELSWQYLLITVWRLKPVLLLLEILLGTTALYQNILRFRLKKNILHSVTLLWSWEPYSARKVKDFSNNIMVHLSGFPPLSLFLIVKFNIKYRIEGPNSFHDSKIGLKYWLKINRIVFTLPKNGMIYYITFLTIAYCTVSQTQRVGWTCKWYFKNIYFKCLKGNIKLVAIKMVEAEINKQPCNIVMIAEPAGRD